MRGLTGEVPENDSDVPFNLQTLRRHLSQVVLARRALSEDVALRQKMLEQSVYNVAVERMKHQAEQMDSLGLPSKGLQSNDLRGWMWKWHQKLQTRIQAEVENLVIEELVLGACVFVLYPRLVRSHRLCSAPSDHEGETQGRGDAEPVPAAAHAGEAVADHDHGDHAPARVGRRE